MCQRDNSLEREGRKARPTPTDLRSVPAEVHAFESHPSHLSNLIRDETGEERKLFDQLNLIRAETGECRKSTDLRQEKTSGLRPNTSVFFNLLYPLRMKQRKYGKTYPYGLQVSSQKKKNIAQHAKSAYIVVREFQRLS